MRSDTVASDVVCHNAQETPFERKAREKIEAHRAKERERASQAKKKVATTVTAKAEQLLAIITAVTGKDEFTMIAEPLRTPLKNMEERLERIIEEAAVIIGDGDYDGPEISVDVKEIAVMASEAKKRVVLVTNMYAQIARMGASG